MLNTIIKFLFIRKELSVVYILTCCYVYTNDLHLITDSLIRL